MSAGGTAGALKWWVLLTCATVAITLAGTGLPHLYFLAAVLLPVPFAALVLLLDSRFALASLLLVVALFFFWTDSAGLFLAVSEKGCLGILYGILFKNRIRADRALAAGVAGAVFLSFMVALGVYILGGGNVFVLEPKTKEEVARLVEAWREAGALENLPPNWQHDFGERLVYNYELLLPGQYALASAISGAVSFFLVKLAAAKIKFVLPPGPGFSSLSYPWYSIWGLIAGLSFVLAGDQYSIVILANTGKNILFVLFYAFLLLGTSVAAHYWQKLKLPFAFKVFIGFLGLVYLPIAITVLLVLGVTDPLVNYRRLPGRKS